MSVRVLLVDDHTMFRQALRVMLEKEAGMEVVGEAGDGAAVAEAADRLAPDVVVMDINLPNLSGMEATRKLLARHPGMRVVALSAHGYKQFVMEMLDAGATGPDTVGAPAQFGWTAAGASRSFPCGGVGGTRRALPCAMQCHKRSKKPRAREYPDRPIPTT